MKASFCSRTRADNPYACALSPLQKNKQCIFLYFALCSLLYERGWSQSVHSVCVCILLELSFGEKAGWNWGSQGCPGPLCSDGAVCSEVGPRGLRGAAGSGGLQQQVAGHASEMAHVELGAFRGKTKHQLQSACAGEPTRQQNKRGRLLFIHLGMIPVPRRQILLTIAHTSHSTSQGHLLMARG